MEESRVSGRRQQVSTVMDDGDIVDLERIARQKRSSLAQVCREFIAEGIERHKAAERAATAVA